MCSARNIIVVILAFTLSVSNTTNLAIAQQSATAHPNETMGARPPYSYESVGSLGLSSKFRSAATPVGDIILELSTGEQVSVCTGFLISPRLVLTARHCLEFVDPLTNTVEPIEPAAINLVLDHLEYLSGTEVPLNLQPVEKGSGDLDYMLLSTKIPIKMDGRIVPLRGSDPTDKEDLYVIHNPSGQILMISRQHCQATEKPIQGDYFEHICDTQPSSSGAPVFDTDFKLVGIHTKGGKSAKPGTFNLGLLLSRIVANSPRVAAALDKNGAANENLVPIATTPVPMLTYILPSGDHFTQNANGWSLIRVVSNGKQVVPLVRQAGSNSEVVLWDALEDVLYRIPRDGGIVMRKKGTEIEWSNLGTAKKE